MDPSRVGDRFAQYEVRGSHAFMGAPPSDSCLISEVLYVTHMPDIHIDTYFGET